MTCIRNNLPPEAQPWASNVTLQLAAMAKQVAALQASHSTTVQGQAGTTTGLSNVTGTANDALSAAGTAQMSADGKNTIHYATTAPTTSTAGVIGDTWFRFSGSNIIGQYKLTAISLPTYTWTAQVMDNAMIASLDVGKLTAGTINVAVELTSATVTGGLIRTAASGAHVAMSGTENAFVAYDSSALVGGLYARTGGLTLESSHGGSSGTWPKAGPAAIKLDYSTSVGFLGNVEIDASYVLIGGTTSNIGQLDIGKSSLGLPYNVTVNGSVTASGFVGNVTGNVSGSAATATTAGTAITALSAGGLTGTPSITVAAAHTNSGLYRDDLSGGGSTGADINNNGAVIRTTSSLRYKTNVVPITVTPEQVRALEPVEFDRIYREGWDDPEYPPEDPHEIGGIAEQFAEHIPMLTFNDAEGRVDGIRYDRLALVQQVAIRDLYARIEALEAGV